MMGMVSYCEEGGGAGWLGRETSLSSAARVRGSGAAAVTPADVHGRCVWLLAACTPTHTHHSNRKSSCSRRARTRARACRSW
jgi:hypothetical protein